MGKKTKTRNVKQSKKAKKTGLTSKIAAGSKSILRVFASLDYPTISSDSSNSAANSNAPGTDAPLSPPWIHFT